MKMKCSPRLGLQLSVSFLATLIFPAFAEVFESRPGPWGQLEFYETVLEPPETSLWEDLYREELIWNFRERTIDEIRQLLEQFGADEQWVEAMASRASWRIADNGVQVIPPHDLAVSLPKEPREKLYRHIWHNGLRRDAIGIEAGSFLGIDRGPFAEKYAEFIDERSLTIDGKRFFPDSPLLIRQLSTQDEKRMMARSLSRTRALMVRLKIDENSDLEEIADYWSIGGSRKDVRPILEGVREAENVDSIDILQLLPPTPRKYLNTYPQFLEMVHYKMPDCYWAAFNFFNHDPRNRMLDTMRPVEFHIDHGYSLVKEGEPLQFGDLIGLFENEGESIKHAWVHIADDIVFTKNGTSQVSPWMLMREKDMLSLYPKVGLHRKVLRPRLNGSDS